MFKDPWVRKAKWLTQALIISGTLNVGLLSTFIYFALNDDKRFFMASEQKNQRELPEQLGLQELIARYSVLSFDDLLLRLASNDHVESGFSRRDLALACLVGFHYFNLERALGGIGVQKREVRFTQGETPSTLTVFPGLADYQYQAIVQYAKTEKWPFTPQGLFLRIQSSKTPYDSSILQAFYLTPEFHFIHLLFTKTGINLKKEHVVALLSQSNWTMISKMADDLRIHSHFTNEERRELLLNLTLQGSKLAAKILLETDSQYCLKYLDNSQILSLCNLLEDKTNPSFLRELLLSPRTDEIWKKAAAILYSQAAEDVPQSLNLEAAKERFIALKQPEIHLEMKRLEKEIEKKATVLKSNSAKYTVISGDSLWKIAQKKNVSVKNLKEFNQLKSDQLKIGQTLLIPSAL